MTSSVEAPFALLQEVVKALLFDPVKHPQMTFRLVPKVLDPIDVIFPIREKL